VATKVVTTAAGVVAAAVGGCLGGNSRGQVGSVESSLFGGEEAKAFTIGKGKMNLEVVRRPVNCRVFAPVFDALRECTSFSNMLRVFDTSMVSEMGLCLASANQWHSLTFDIL
jgi:hypothetical protein